jgi:hypothetical protein
MREKKSEQNMNTKTKHNLVHKVQNEKKRMTKQHHQRLSWNIHDSCVNHDEVLSLYISIFSSSVEIILFSQMPFLKKLRFLLTENLKNYCLLKLKFRIPFLSYLKKFSFATKHFLMSFVQHFLWA